MSVERDLNEHSARSEARMTVRESRRGLFPPKIRGDPLAAAMQDFFRAEVAGDRIPAAANLIGSGARSFAQASQIAQLGSLNPFTTLSSILLERFVTGPTIGNFTQTVERHEVRPQQSQVEVGLLRIHNDRTHLEGIWTVDQAHIQTGELRAISPRATVEQHSRSSGWAISFSPLILLNLALPATALSWVASLPTLSFQNASSDGHWESVLPSQFRANELFIRCDNAVFSGSQVEAKLLELMVTGQIRIEALTDLFQGHSRQRNFALSLSAAFGAIQSIPRAERLPIDSGLSAVPQFSIAREDELLERVHQAAALVGHEQFLLQVGKLLHTRGVLIPDGHVQLAEGAQRVDEPVPERQEHHRHVFNPCISELLSMSQNLLELRDAWNQLRSQRLAQNLHDGMGVVEADANAGQVTEEYVQAYQAEEQQLERAVDHSEAIAERFAETVVQHTSPQEMEMLRRNEMPANPRAREALHRAAATAVDGNQADIAQTQQQIHILEQQEERTPADNMRHLRLLQQQREQYRYLEYFQSIVWETAQSLPPEAGGQEARPLPAQPADAARPRSHSPPPIDTPLRRAMADARELGQEAIYTVTDEIGIPRFVTDITQKAVEITAGKIAEKLNDLTFGAVAFVGKFLDGKWYATKTRRFLRDTLHVNQETAQNVGDGIGCCANIAAFLFLAGRGAPAAKTAKKAAKLRKVQCVKGYEAIVTDTVASGQIEVTKRHKVLFKGRSASTVARRAAGGMSAERKALCETHKIKVLNSGIRQAAEGGFIRELPDGRIRYYSVETPARTADYMRGERYVVEHNTRTGRVKSWKETVNQQGKIEMIHLDTINGMILEVPHCPYTPPDLEKFFGGVVECLEE
jgi:hypothetical protein